MTTLSVATNANLPTLAPKTWTMTIGGTPVNIVAGSLDVQNQIGQRSMGRVTVWSGRGVTWLYGTQVKVFDANNVARYVGYVSKDKAIKESRQNTGYLEHQLTLMDNIYKADKRRAFGTFNNVSAGFIVNNLLTNYLSKEGVTSKPGSIASGVQIIQVIWSGKKSVAEAITWLATQSGYWWNIDSNGILWFQPYSGTPAPWVMDGTQAAVDTSLSVTFGNDQFVNRQFVKGGYAETAQRVETFIGNGNARTFTLAYPVSSIKSIFLDGVKQVVQTKNNTIGANWIYSSADPVIAQADTGVTLTSSDTLVVTYKGRYPIIALAANNTLIAQQRTREGGGTGYVEASYSNAQVTNQTAAFSIASALLSHYAADMTQLEFDTLTPGLVEGQMLTVKLPDFNLNNTKMLITDVEITDTVNDQYNIWYHVLAVGSPLESMQWQTFWANLMNQNSDPADLTDLDSSVGVAFLANSVITLPYPAITPGALPQALPLGLPVSNPLLLPLLVPAVPKVTVTAGPIVCPILPITLPFTLC